LGHHGEELFALIAGDSEEVQGEVKGRDKVDFSYERALQKVRLWPPVAAPHFAVAEIHAAEPRQRVQFLNFPRRKIII